MGKSRNQHSIPFAKEKVAIVERTAVKSTFVTIEKEERQITKETDKQAIGIKTMACMPQSQF
jgi:hypothetical protein